MGTNRDGERIAEVTAELTKRAITYQVLPPNNDDQLALLALVRPERSQTSFHQIRKAVEKKGGTVQGSDDQPRRERYQSRDERRFRIAQIIRQYCFEHGLRVWDDQENTWEYAIFTAVSKKRLEDRGCKFLAETDNESVYSDLRKYQPTPIWDGSGDQIVINTDLFETDEQLERTIDELFSTIELSPYNCVK